MFDDIDSAYYELRMREEHERALEAEDPCAAATHRQLAREYERRLQKLRAMTMQAHPAPAVPVLVDAISLTGGELSPPIPERL